MKSQYSVDLHDDSSQRVFRPRSFSLAHFAPENIAVVIVAILGALTTCPKLNYLDIFCASWIIILSIRIINGGYI